MLDIRRSAVGLLVLSVPLVLTFFLAGWQSSLNPDHGNDLYAGWAALRGQAPYRDFHWIYGPLVPYALAAGFAVFGESVRALRLVGLFALVAGAWLTFRVARRLLSPGPASVVAMAVFGWGLPYQHYHYPLVVPIMAGALLSLIRYAESRRPAWLSTMATLLAILCGFKLNLGVPVGLALFFGCLVAESGRIRSPQTPAAANLVKHFGLWMFLTAALYLPFVAGLSAERLRLCFPYATMRSGDPLQPWVAARALPDLVLGTLAKGVLPAPSDFLERGWALPFLFAVVLLGFAVPVLRSALRWRDLTPESWLRLVLWLLVVGAGSEFMLRGTHYSLYQFAALPILCLAGLAARPLARRLGREWPWVLAGVGMLLGIGLRERPRPVVVMDHARIRVSTSPLHDVPSVIAASDFIERHTEPGEKIAGFPIASLYYFLANRPSALWRNTYYGLWPPSDQEEQDIIQRLGREPVRCIVVMPSVGRRAGFGEVYARQVWRYLRQHYVPVETADAGPRAALILWRKGRLLPSRPRPWPPSFPE